MEKKIEFITSKSQECIMAINHYLDRIYDIRDKFFENGELKEGLEEDPQFTQILKDLIEKEAPEFEKVRTKLINGDFNLSLVEINYIGLGFVYTRMVWEDKIKILTNASKEADEMINCLMGDSTYDSFLGIMKKYH